MNRSAIYTPAAVAQESLSPGQVLTYAGPANLVLLDVPSVVDDMDATGLLVGVGGMLDGWTGGTLFRSADNGQTWSDIHSFTTGMVSGVVIDAIGDGRTDIIDAVNVMSIGFMLVTSTASARRHCSTGPTGLPTVQTSDGKSSEFRTSRQKQTDH